MFGGQIRISWQSWRSWQPSNSIDPLSFFFFFWVIPTLPKRWQQIFTFLSPFGTNQPLEQGDYSACRLPKIRLKLLQPSKRYGLKRFLWYLKHCYRLQMVHFNYLDIKKITAQIRNKLFSLESWVCLYRTVCWGHMYTNTQWWPLASTVTDPHRAHGPANNQLLALFMSLSFLVLFYHCSAHLQSLGHVKFSANTHASLQTLSCPDCCPSAPCVQAPLHNTLLDRSI